MPVGKKTTRVMEAAKQLRVAQAAFKSAGIKLGFLDKAGQQLEKAQKLAGSGDEPSSSNGVAVSELLPSIKKIDLTPTWRQILPVLVRLIQDGNAEAQKAAWDEIYKLADRVDAMNATLKEVTEKE